MKKIPLLLCGVLLLLSLTACNRTVTSEEAHLAATATSPSVVYEKVELCAYEDGSPYIHEVKSNQTDRTITTFARGMLAFDREGNPLKMDWFSLDSDYEPSYEYVYDWDTDTLPPGETTDETGGWSLNLHSQDPQVEKIAYVLYCDQTITFDDGTVWINPAYDSWLNEFCGKTAKPSRLDQYYPYVMTIDPAAEM